MQNDMLKNTIAPWQEKGRWYHVIVKSNGSVWSIVTDKSDQFCVDNFSISSGTYLNISPNRKYEYFDFKGIIHTSDAVINTTFNLTTTLTFRYSANDTFILLPAPAYLTGELELYLYRFN